MIKKLAGFIAPLLVLSLVFPVSTFAYEVPKENTKAEYFYLFGPEGDPLRGKDDSQMSLFVDVPKASTEAVTISVYDADASGKVDAIGGFGKAVADTETVFSVEGKETLVSETFGAGSSKGDASWTQLGSFKPEQGKDVGDFYRFRVVAKTTKGDDQNLFKFKITPDYAESFSEKFYFRLLPSKGSQINFYPAIPAGVTGIVARNFDLDKDGGVGQFKDHATGKSYDVADSVSGQWAETPVTLGSSDARRLAYTVTTTNQTRGNAGVQFTDSKGNALPIYFKQGGFVAPVAPSPEPSACNVFEFDARDSYDTNKDKITYLWDFGDGRTSTDPVVTHVYEKGGNYNVALTVSDNSGLHCEKKTTTTPVLVNTPPVCGLKVPQSACVGQAVSISGAGSSDGETKELGYLWNFGDGTTAEGASVSKTFSKGGNYNVSLTVNDNQNTACSVAGCNAQIKVNSAPVAVAGDDVALCLTSQAAEYAVTFNGGKSYDAENDGLSYAWDFGDGEKAEGAKVTHVYKQAGEYTARLTVTDNSGAGCNVSTDTVSVRLNKSPIVDAGENVFSCSGGAVTLNANGPEGSKYTWNLGDGTVKEGKSVTHTYAKGGSYTATVTVDDGKGTPCSTAMDAVNVRINSAPMVSLNQAKNACTGETVSLDASASNDPDGDKLKYTWNFGDGTTIEGGSNVSYAYKKGGNYTVTVTADDGAGSACSVSAAKTRVSVNTPPIANAGPNLVCCTEEQSQFNGAQSSDPDGDKLSYLWNFGDGNTGEGVAAQHAYSKFGQYNVTLTVDDGKGTHCSTASSGFVADVNAGPVPLIKVKAKNYVK
ncbi:MAG TPA: PKD domain-containing protein [Candidatus Omnitrophota bacterium]|nr:PKD domain-containing protein [Candidatus Omnitrophota bacterium]